MAGNRDALKVGTVAVTAPAVATDFSYTADQDMIVRSIIVKLVTDANAANRTMQLTFEDSSANVFWRAGVNANMVASLTHQIVLSRIPLAPNSTVEQTVWRIPIPADGVFLPKNGKIKSVSANLQAADQISAIVVQFEKP